MSLLAELINQRSLMMPPKTVGVTKAPFVYFSMIKIFVPLRITY